MVWRAGVVDTDPAVGTFAEEKTQSSIHAAVQCCLYRRRRIRPCGFFEKKRCLVVDEIEVRVREETTR